MVNCICLIFLHTSACFQYPEANCNLFVYVHKFWIFRFLSYFLKILATAIQLLYFRLKCKLLSSLFIYYFFLVKCKQFAWSTTYNTYTANIFVALWKYKHFNLLYHVFNIFLLYYMRYLQCFQCIKFHYQVIYLFMDIFYAHSGILFYIHDDSE